MDLCFTEEGCSSNNIVLEKQVFQSKVPESHVQLACDLHYCAFPLNGNELCIWNTTDDSDHQVKKIVSFSVHFMYKNAKISGFRQWFSNCGLGPQSG